MYNACQIVPLLQSFPSQTYNCQHCADIHNINNGVEVVFCSKKKVGHLWCPTLPLDRSI